MSCLALVTLPLEDLSFSGILVSDLISSCVSDLISVFDVYTDPHTIG